MRGSYLTTPVTVQNASAEKTRVWVACALAATRKQLADEKLERPGLFKEALLGEYRERAIYEKSPSSVVVELEHPHFLSKVALVSHQLPQEVSTFEFEKTESGTLSYGVEPPRPRRRGSTLVPVPMPPKEIKHAKFCRFAAWLRALDWWRQQLEWRLQPLSTDALFEKPHPPTRPKEAPDKATKKKQSVAKEKRPRGLENLPPKKIDISRYIDSAKLTDRQRNCYSLNKEYGLGPTEIAHRLGLKHHSTAQYHIARADALIRRAGELAKKARKTAGTS